MPTALKRPRTRAAAPVTSAAKTPRGSKPYLRFYFSEKLRSRTLAAAAAVEKSEDGREHGKALAEVVVDLTNCGMDYYFLKPLRLAKVSFFVEQSANLGITATTGMMASVIRKVIGGMDRDQLVTVCSYLRQLMK